MKPSDERQRPESAPAKKAYSPPRIEVYGKLRDIAQAVGNTGIADGASGNPNHQHTRP
jgi:hypothetical protein